MDIPMQSNEHHDPTSQNSYSFVAPTTSYNHVPYDYLVDNQIQLNESRPYGTSSVHVRSSTGSAPSQRRQVQLQRRTEQNYTSRSVNSAPSISRLELGSDGRAQRVPAIVDFDKTQITGWKTHLPDWHTVIMGMTSIMFPLLLTEVWISISTDQLSVLLEQAVGKLRITMGSDWYPYPPNGRCFSLPLLLYSDESSALQSF